MTNYCINKHIAFYPGNTVIENFTERRFSLKPELYNAIYSLSMENSFTFEMLNKNLKIPEKVFDFLIENSLIVKSDYKQEKDFTLRFAEIEISRHCNLSCRFCPVFHEPRPYGLMDQSLFIKIIDELSRHRKTLKAVAINSYNEPTLVKNLTWWIHNLSQRNIPFMLSTNGTNITQNLAGFLMKSGNCLEIVVNLPTLSKEKYKNLMGRNFLEKVLSGIDLLIKNGLNMKIIVNGTLDSDHAQETLLIREKYSPYLNVTTVANPITDRAQNLKNEYFLGVENSSNEFRFCGYGNRLFNWIHINYRGDCFICPEDYEQKYVMGNLGQMDLDDILNNEIHNQWKRYAFGIEESPPDFICKRCSGFISRDQKNEPSKFIRDFSYLQKLGSGSKTFLSIFSGEIKKLYSAPRFTLIEKDEKHELIKTLKSRVFGTENRTFNELHKEFEEYIQVNHALSVNSGTSALYIALKAFGLESDDEVIVPAYTFYSSGAAVIQAGGTPVFVDISPDDYCISVECVLNAITSSTKGIIVVHLAGQSCDMESILEIARKNRLFVIEDCAQSIGGRYGKRMLGSFGDAAIFSFESRKTLNCGEGGMIVTNSTDLHDTFYSLQNCGRKKGKQFFDHHCVAGNYRMSAFQAGVLRAQLKHLDFLVEKKQENARILEQKLLETGGIKIIRKYYENSLHANWAFVFEVDSSTHQLFSKNQMSTMLFAEGFGTQFGYNPLPLQRFYYQFKNFQKNYDENLIKNAMNATRKSIWIPQNLLVADKKTLGNFCKSLTRILNTRDDLRLEIELLIN